MCHRAAERPLLCQKTGLNEKSWVCVIHCPQCGPEAKTRKDEVRRGKGINIRGYERGEEEREERKGGVSDRAPLIDPVCC